jgi:transcription antitermination factor NusG
MHEDLSTMNLQVPHWYVLFVRSNQEKRVAHRLAGLDVEHYLPCFESLRQWKDRRVRLAAPLFPGYVFVRLPLLERAKVLTLPNVVSFVGPRNSPSTIADDEIACIRQGVEQGRAEPHEFLRAGQRVVITSGVMSGMEGILLRTKNNTRVVVSLDTISRSFVVDVDAACVQPVDS